jgi:hypothetical protein
VDELEQQDQGDGTPEDHHQLRLYRQPVIGQVQERVSSKGGRPEASDDPESDGASG